MAYCQTDAVTVTFIIVVPAVCIINQQSCSGPPFVWFSSYRKLHVLYTPMLLELACPESVVLQATNLQHRNRCLPLESLEEVGPVQCEAHQPKACSARPVTAARADSGETGAISASWGKCADCTYSTLNQTTCTEKIEAGAQAYAACNLPCM